MENHFTIAIETCNHEKWIEGCLNSCLTQKYGNYDVILVDAISDDKTYEISKKYIEEFPKLKVYQNEVRLPQVANFVWLAELAKPKSIIVSVDGDDMLKGPNVLAKLNEVYNSGEVWMTYGSYQEANPHRDVSWHYRSYPEEVIKNNSFREYDWLASHLRTFRRELLLSVDKYWLTNDDGTWIYTPGDQAMMLTLLEKSGERSRFIKDILYLYNVGNTTRDGAVNEARQLEMAKYVRAKKKCTRMESL